MTCRSPERTAWCLSKVNTLSMEVKTRLSAPLMPDTNAPSKGDHHSAFRHHVCQSSLLSRQRAVPSSHWPVIHPTIEGVCTVSRLGTCHTVPLRLSPVPPARTSGRGASAPRAGDTHTPSLSSGCQRPSPPGPHPSTLSRVCLRQARARHFARTRLRHVERCRPPGHPLGPASRAPSRTCRGPPCRPTTCTQGPGHACPLPALLGSAGACDQPFPVGVFGEAGPAVRWPRTPLPVRVTAVCYREYSSSLAAKSSCGCTALALSPRGDAPGARHAVFWNRQAEA